MVQARARYLNRQHLRTPQLVLSQWRRGFRVALGISRAPLDAADDSLRIGSIRSTKLLDRRLHTVQRMLGQQLQNPDILPNSGPRTVPVLQPLA